MPATVPEQGMRGKTHTRDNHNNAGVIWHLACGRIRELHESRQQVGSPVQIFLRSAYLDDMLREGGDEAHVGLHVRLISGRKETADFPEWVGKSLAHCVGEHNGVLLIT